MPIRGLAMFAILTSAVTSGCKMHAPAIDLATPQSAETLNAAAIDKSRTPDERCLAIFALFKDYLKPGSTQAEIKAVLADASWLNPKNLRGIYILCGWIPVRQESADDTAFVLDVLPEVAPSTGRPPNCGYHIYFVLENAESEESAFAALTGRHVEGGDVVLKQFALCYPDGTIEVFTKDGMAKVNLGY